MEQPASNETASHEREVSIGRRQLLKVLATSSMVAAATQLPTHWTTPLAEGGRLPAHAQVSTTSYTGVCDSTPGGGDILPNDGIIQSIRPYLVVVGGTGTVQGISTTMSLSPGAPSTLTFNPSLPQTVTTDSNGRADFGDLSVIGVGGEQFSLIFNFATPSGNIPATCGVFQYGQPNNPTNK
jgi:hypothetical protein